MGHFLLTVSPLVSYFVVAKVIQKLVAEMRANPGSVKFSNAVKVAEYYFGAPRRSGSSHHVFKMPWAGDPRVNLQDDGRRAKQYQVRQLLLAIDKSEATDP